MATVLDDLWPEDIKVDDVLTPSEILEQQAKHLANRTSNILFGRVERTEAEDRMILGFDVCANRIPLTVRLFSVQHRKDLEYPAAINPPDDKLPRFLKERSYRQGYIGPMESVVSAMYGEEVTNEWIATSPTEFTEKVAKVLGSAGVKATVLSLISRSTNAAEKNDQEKPSQDS